MALTTVKRTDPFDFPPSIVPKGLKYQWVGEMPNDQPSFKEMRDRGWVVVPPEWHPGVFKEEVIVAHSISVCGNVLMCHASSIDEESKRITGALQNIEDWINKYAPPTVHRAPKYRWLAWLFNLISVEEINHERSRVFRSIYGPRSD